MIWQKRYTRSNNTVDFTNVTEHILVYSKSDNFVVNLLPRNEQTDSGYTNPDNDPRGPWITSSFVNPATKEARPALVYAIEAPDGRKVVHPTHAWKQSKENCEKIQAEGRFWWGLDGKAKYPRLKLYLSEARGLTPINYWSHEYAGNTDMGGNELKDVLGSKVFDYPKPSLLIKRVLEHASSKDSIILDSFAGSGTTAQAVMQKNAEDGGHRRFILVEMNDYADGITAERSRKVIGGYGDGSETRSGVDSGFSFYELGPALFDGDGMLNPDVDTLDVMKYVWHTETKEPFMDCTDECSYLMGTVGHTVYYLCYEPGEEVCLTPELLGAFTRREQTTVVYADRCLIDSDTLDRLGIVFKQVPREIVRM